MMSLLAKWFVAGALCMAALPLVGCGGADRSAETTEVGATLPASYFLDSAPEGATVITELKANAKEGDEVVVYVVVGGVESPIVAGRASATVIDAGVVNPCTKEDDHCETPWDYCCTPNEDKTPNLATLQVVDDAGKVLAADLTAHFKPLATLIVKGVVGPRANDEVLTIHATGIYIESAAP